MDDINGVSCDDFYDTTASNMRESSWKIAVACVAVIVVQAIGFILLYYGFGTASERMNKRVRDAAFTSLIRQEVAFYGTIHCFRHFFSSLSHPIYPLTVCKTFIPLEFSLRSYKTMLQ